MLLSPLPSFYLLIHWESKSFSFPRNQFSLIRILMTKTETREAKWLIKHSTLRAQHSMAPRPRGSHLQTSFHIHREAKPARDLDPELIQIMTLCLHPRDSDSVNLNKDPGFCLSPVSQVVLIQPFTGQSYKATAASMNAGIKPCNKCSLHLMIVKHRAQHPETQVLLSAGSGV